MQRHVLTGEHRSGGCSGGLLTGVGLLHHFGEQIAKSGSGSRNGSFAGDTGRRPRRLGHRGPRPSCGEIAGKTVGDGGHGVGPVSVSAQRFPMERACCAKARPLRMTAILASYERLAEIRSAISSWILMAG